MTLTLFFISFFLSTFKADVVFILQVFEYFVPGLCEVSQFEYQRHCFIRLAHSITQREFYIGLRMLLCLH